MGRQKKIIATTAEMAEPAEVEQVETFSAPLKSGGFVVQWGIKVDGERYKAGDTVSLSDEAAAPFLASGAIVRG